MTPKQTNVEPSDEPWLALRRRHDTELNNLQLQARNLYEQFQQNANKAKADLLAKHKKEEEEFWSKAKAAGKDKNKSGNSSVVFKAGVQGQVNRRVVALPPPNPTPEVRQTPAAISRAPQTPTSAYNTTTLARQNRKNSAAVTIIDLCSDDDELVQEQKKPGLPPVTNDITLSSHSSKNIEPAGRREYSISSASFELFGRSANRNQGVPESSQFKREHSVSTQQFPQPSTPLPTTSNRGSTTAFPTQQSSTSKGDGFGDWASAGTFRMPAAQAQDSRQGSASAFGTIPASATSTWAAPTISASQDLRLLIDFAPSRLSGCQLSQSSIAQGSTLHGRPLDYGGTSNGSIAISQDRHIPEMLPSPSPSPPTLIIEPFTPTIPGFRRPVLPASATKDSIPAARNVRAGSQATASTYRASSITQNQPDSSVTSRTSVSSHSSVARGKRKVVDLSSDEESDYSPPSDEDDEPKFPMTTDEVCNSTKSNTKKPGPTAKKAKLPPPLPPAIASKSVFSKGKNGFGFQPTSKPKSNQAAFSLPNPPPPDLEARTNIAIDEANEYEAPEAGVVEQVRGSLRSMSITPAPSTAEDHVNATEDVEILAVVSDSGSTIAVQSTKHGAGWNSWTHRRANGDRNLAKSRSSRPLVRDDEEDDDYEDPDISKYSIIDGTIVHEADLERTRLTQEQDRRNHMISRETDSGGRTRSERG
ncbi:uncharacterized protein ALTATR162_LOCUS5755 [Alternaria atra]|uniref:Uncharacterized protein n=1 Tax=Alternaria atra TaxID=119953 RepID=A0A8J2I5G9_9PLEO|nr:uncharacterized protein ALTATR162_LOCUS5755 [Alternaria atra]CAG5160178.1 unnamed protein product [Alternaria atra]